MEEATVTSGAPATPAQPGLPPECQMSTDDLVLMIGEAAVQARQDLKIKQYQGKQIVSLSQALMQERSQKETLSAKTAAVESDKAANEKQIHSYQERILQLEDQVLKTAQDRDEANKRIAELTAQLNSRPQKRISGNALKG